MKRAKIIQLLIIVSILTINVTLAYSTEPNFYKTNATNVNDQSCNETDYPDFDSEEKFKSLSDYLIFVLSDDFENLESNTLEGCDEMIWAFNLPFDFKIKDQSLLFSFVDFEPNKQTKSHFSKDEQYLRLDFRNYFFWLSDKYLFVLHDPSIFESRDSSYFECYGRTSCNSPFSYDYQVLELNECNEWQIIYPSKCEVSELWLNARYGNIIDYAIKQEIFFSKDLRPDCLVAPTYDNVRNTLFQNEWTLNPSYANNLYYATSNAEGSIACTLIFNAELFETYFDPIRYHLSNNGLKQCTICVPRFALTGDTLFIRLEHKLCTLNPNGVITQELIKTTESTYRYTPMVKRWIKQQ